MARALGSCYPLLQRMAARLSGAISAAPAGLRGRRGLRATDASQVEGGKVGGEARPEGRQQVCPLGAGSERALEHKHRRDR